MKCFEKKQQKAEPMKASPTVDICQLYRQSVLYTFLDFLPKMLNLVWEVVWYAGDPVWMQPCCAPWNRRHVAEVEQYTGPVSCKWKMTRTADEWFCDDYHSGVQKKKKLGCHTFVRL